MSLENLFSRNLVNRKTVFFSTFMKVHTKLYIIERSDETKSQPILVLLRKGWARLVEKAVKYLFHSSGTEHGSC